MKRVLAIAVCACFQWAIASQSYSQTHFTNCVASTGANATILINETISPTINGATISAGDEIAVFTQDGICAGVETWTGDNIAVTVWGDNSLTTEKDGLSASEQMNFVVWDASSQTEYGDGFGSVSTGFVSESPYNGSGLYSQDAIYQLTVLTAAPPVAPVASMTATPTSGSSPLIVSVDGSGSSDSDGSIASYAWNFGDGSTGTGQTTSHTFNSAGTYTITLTVTDTDGLTATDTATITVSNPPQNSPPTATFILDVSSGTIPFSVSVNGTGSTDSDGTIQSYAWVFGDGSTATGSSATHQYTAAGTYDIVLTVTDNEGATGSFSRTVTANAPANTPPVASFTASPSSGDAPLTTNFDASASTDSDGTISSYSWDFGNGQFGSGVNPTTIYTSSGTYTVQLTVTDNSGATNSATTVVTVTTAPGNQSPTSAFSASTLTGTAPLVVSFDGSASSDPDGSISAYSWIFGDGSNTSGVTATHTFSQPGTYQVVLTVTDDDGATASSQRTITVTSLPANESPIASFSTSATGGSTPLLVQVNATGSTDSDGNIVSYEWDFGDGNSGSGIVASHTYTEAGSYTLTLIVTDNGGATDQASQIISVTSPPTSGSLVMYLSFDETSGVNAADISGNSNDGTLFQGAAFSSSSGVVNGAVRFNGQESYVDVADADELNEQITTQRSVALWFKADDVDISSRKQILYEEGGQQKGVSLYLFDGQVFIGGWNRLSSESGWDGSYLTSGAISSGVWHHVVLILEGGPTISSGALRAYLDGALIGTGDGSQLWEHRDDIGIGGVDGDTWFHDMTNREGGKHGLSGFLDELRVYNYPLSEQEINNLASAGSSPNQAPIAIIEADAETGVAPATIGFSGAGSSDSDGSIQSYTWDFGNGLTASGVSATTTYAAAGSYSVQLTVIDNSGGTDTATKTVVVTDATTGAPPIAEIVEQPRGLNTMSIELSGATSQDNDGSIQSFAWSFGDGSTASGEVVSHEFSQPGSYLVSLVVTDNDGLTSQTTAWVSVYRDLPDETGSIVIGVASSLDPGYANLASDVLSIRSPSAIRTDDLDAMRFVYESITGDGTLTMRVVNSNGTGDAAQIGVMIRSQLTPAATMVELSLNSGGSAEFVRRPVAGVSSESVGSASTTTESWIRIERKGNSFNAFVSFDGIIWSLVGNAEVGMPETVFMGISSWTTNGTAFEATLDNISFDSNDEALPDGYILSEAYPNPFNPSSQMTLIVDNPQEVTVNVYSMTGQLVQSIFSGEVMAHQNYEYRFVATDALASGMYLLRVKGEDFAATRKVILLK